MKTFALSLLTTVALFFAPFLVVSCDILDKVQDNVEIVSDRGPNGQYTKPVFSDGSTVDGQATLYRSTSGKFGVTPWTSGSVAGQAPKLARVK